MYSFIISKHIFIVYFDITYCFTLILEANSVIYSFDLEEK